MVDADTTASFNPQINSSNKGHAYLFRGRVGLIDWGMDELAQRINLPLMPVSSQRSSCASRLNGSFATE